MHSTNENTISLLQLAKLIPPLHLERLKDAVPMTYVLVEYALPTMEIGLRTKVDTQAIMKIID